MNQDNIGKKIKSIRTSNKLTQQQFANKYGVTYQAVSNWEHGKNLPDISLLKEISKDYNFSLDELLDNKKIKYKNKYLIILLSIIVFISLLLIFILKKDNNFEFKTISSNCDNFNISGSIAYNDKKTSIYINNVNYCGGNDTILYSNLECVLYESHDNKDNKISSYNYNKKNKITLEDFLKKINFTIDNYSKTCKNYSDKSLYLKINAIDSDNRTITYRIPLSLNDACKK